nr:unnamed protein product [Callosobruchus analis]
MSVLTFFEAHPDLSHGRLKGLNARERAKQLWVELTRKLNSLGFGERSVDKWQKYLIKKKGASSNRDHLSTGGGPATTDPFNKFELRALKLLGKAFYDGLGVAENEFDKNLKGPQLRYGIGEESKKTKNIDDAYVETIEVLRGIKTCLHAGLADFKNSLDGIRSAIITQNSFQTNSTATGAPKANGQIKRMSRLFTPILGKITDEKKELTERKHSKKLTFV